jgi:hypothetical protein
MLLKSKRLSRPENPADIGPSTTTMIADIDPGRTGKRDVTGLVQTANRFSKAVRDVE